MRVVIIGGSGHIGTYLVPTLVEMGYEVINLTRGQSKPYTPNRAWESVKSVTVDRDAEDAAGTFGERVKALKPDIVIDLICFTEESNRQLVEALRGQVQHFIHCGTIWVYGHSTQVPALEDQPRHPFGNYGIQKAAIEAYLMREARLNGFPATDLLVGHITGPGWKPINAQANLNASVFEKLARGEALPIPNLGLETLHHVHAADVAQMFVQAITHWSASVGESFHTVSPAALTLRGYAEAVAGWFGQEANLQFMNWDEYTAAVGEVDAGVTKDHIGHSPNASIAKAQRMIDYQPRYSSLQSIHEAVDWLVENGQVKV